jgi:hypothetical protein
MRWFVAWFVTAVLTGIVGALYWLAGAGMPVISPVLTRLQPPLVDLTRFFGAPALIVGLQFACWTLTRLVTIRVFAYVNSETEASPRGQAARAVGGRGRGRDGWKTALGALIVRLLHNPTGRWLLPFAAVLNLVVFAAAPLELRSTIEAAPVHPAWWGLSALYAMTLAAAAVPDRLIPLRPRGAEPEPDPVLDQPADDDASPQPALGAP